MQFLTTDKILPVGHKPANNVTKLQQKCEMSLMMHTMVVENSRPGQSLAASIVGP
jgi:hypothetical protein